MTTLEKAATEMLQCVDRMLTHGEWYNAQETAEKLRDILTRAEPVDERARERLVQAEPVVEPSVESMLQAGRFCDANCTAMDHHADCVIGNPSW